MWRKCCPQSEQSSPRLVYMFVHENVTQMTLIGASVSAGERRWLTGTATSHKDSWDGEVDSTDMTLYSLVTAVPLPGVTWPVGEEVCRPLVLDSLREPQQHTGVIVSNAWPIGWAAKRKNKSVSLQEKQTKKKAYVIYGHNYVIKIALPTACPPLSRADFRCLSEGCLCVNSGWKNSLKTRGLFGFKFSIMCLPFVLSPLGTDCD